MTPYILSIIFAIIGLSIALYIYVMKVYEHRARDIACPLDGKECSNVITSKYSTFMGVDNTLMGILYYAFIIVVDLIMLFSSTINETYTYIFFIITTLAFLFSLYLVFIQLFKLKQICSWCMTSAFCSLVIFGSALWVVLS